MRNNREMLELVRGVAEKDGRVRAVVMNGSRANPNAPKDIFQDFDIVYIVNQIDTFINDDDWIDIFGERLMLQLPEAKTKALLPPENNGAFVYLMLFKDGNRIDLTLMPLEKMDELLANDSSTIVLLDKDGLLPHFDEPSDKDYWEKRPTENMYDECCNEFWWVLQNTAKGIWRDELPYAKRMFTYSRDMLDQMLCWYIGSRHDFKIAAGKMGKYFKRYLEDDLWTLYYRTYSDGDYDHFWEAIFAACELFRTVGKRVSEYFHYSYNDEEDTNMSRYLKQVGELPKDAENLIL